MAFIYTDPNVAAPFITFQVKDVTTKVFKLPFSYFTSAGTNTLVGVLPADASILKFTTWVKTALSGNTVSAPTISIGTASAGTQFASAVAITNTTGTEAVVTPVTGIMQAHDNINRTDIPLWVGGGCTSGPPTAGEIYLMVEYVR